MDTRGWGGCVAWALAVCTVLLPAGAQAGGFVMSAQDGASRAERLAPLGSVEFHAELDEAGARVTEQRFYNHVAPLPVPVLTGRFYRSIVGPAGTRFEEARVFDEPLAGEVLEPDAADALRRELVRELGDPAPLREQGTPMFVSEPLELNSPGYGVSISVTTRVPWSARGTLSAVDVPLDWAPENAGLVSLDVEARTEAPLRALYAPYHELAVSREGDHAATASYRGHDVCTRFAVTLLMSTGSEPVRLDLVPFRYDAVDGGHVLALLTPPAVAAEGDRRGRDIVLALDVSGSMEGDKIAQARDALSGVLAGLDVADRVALVSFQSTVTGLGEAAVSASADAIADAQAFVDGLTAGGGTNISGALAASLGMLPLADERPRYVVLLTDGQPTEGITEVDAIVDAVTSYDGSRVRVFPFGIGYDVNTRLLDRLAAETGGSAIYVRPGDSVTAAVGTFFGRIADPVLTGPELRFEGLGVERVHPAALPDLYAGETLAVLARYSTPGTGRALLTGVAGDGRAEYPYEVTLPEHALDAGFVPRVWALREVGALLSAIKLGEAGQDAEDEIAAVASRYGVVTDFTGYELDEAGDAHFVYSPVPIADTGAAAVEASASISGYTQGSAADAADVGELRYHSDRAFAIRDGYYTDTRLASGPSWVDLHFGSELYFELAEREPWARGLLAIAKAVRFEWLGNAYRVTDPAATEGAELPPEVATLPASREELSSGGGPTVAAVMADAAGETRVTPEDPNSTLDPEAGPGTEPAKHVSACHVARAGSAHDVPGWLGVLGLAVAWGWRRRGRRANDRQRSASARTAGSFR